MRNKKSIFLKKSENYELKYKYKDIKAKECQEENIIMRKKERKH